MREGNGCFFLSPGINIVCLEDLRGWEGIILDHSLLKDKVGFFKLYLESNSPYAFQGAAAFLLKPFTLTLSGFEICLVVSPAPESPF